MPILIGLYWVISQINESSNFYHLYSFFKDFNPTTISTWFGGVDLAAVGGWIAVIFAIALGILQYIQAKLSFSYTHKKEKAPQKEEEKSQTEIALDPKVMENMMLYFFPILIAVTSYFFPLGVGLYWFIGTLFVIGQQAYVNRKHK
jgi:membrane protein insertase Oxa1/YidC/SpoIIIJ